MQNIGFFITTTGWGGLEMNVLKMALGMTELDYKVTLITAVDSRIALEAKSKIDSLVTINTPKKYFDFKSAKGIAQILRQKGISTLIVNDNRDLDVISWTKKLHFPRLKVIYHQQMQIGINKRDLLHTLRFKSINYWISPLNWLRVEIGKNTRYPVERVKIIPLCADVERFSTPKYSKKEALKKLGLSPKGKLIGIIGRITQKKGQWFVIKAFKELLATNPDLELLIFGSATINDPESQKYEQDIHAYVKENELSTSVHFIPFSSDSELFYNAVDIFTIASESETFGMVTIEAMLSQIPIIAADTGGSPEILNEGELGRLYNYDNIEDYCNQVKWVLSNPEKASEVAKQAKAKASKEYSHHSEMTKISEVIALAEADK